VKSEPQLENWFPKGFKSRIPFFSKNVEKQVFAFLDFLHRIHNQDISDIFRIAFGSVMVSFSNYTYEPSLSSRPGAGKSLIDNANVHAIILGKLHEILTDIRWLKDELGEIKNTNRWRIYNNDFMESHAFLPAGSIDLMVTSPPYMNNYHYVRNTRPQLFWLSLVSSPKDLKKLEEANVGKFWQTVRHRDPIELNFEHLMLKKVLFELRKARNKTASTISLDLPLNRVLRRVISRFDMISIFLITSKKGSW